MAKRMRKAGWIDASGNPIPVKYVDPVEKKRDPMVERLHREAVKVRNACRSSRNWQRERLTSISTGWPLKQYRQAE